MVGQKQTIFGEGHGNCFATCLASILELSVEEVPNFCDVDLYPGDNGEWYWAVDAWLGEHFGLSILTFGAAENEEWLSRGYSILSGRSPRGEFNHSVVALDGKIVWDPHPSDDGLVNKKDWIVFTVRDPAKYVVK
jgi:hypothetical protein